MELVSDERVFEGFEMDACLRVSVDVKVGDVRLERRVDFGHNGIPHPSDAHPLPQFALLLSENRNSLSHHNSCYILQLSLKMG